MAERGVTAREVVVLGAPDSIELAVTRYASSSMGAVVVMLSPLSPAGNCLPRLCESGARRLVTTPDLFAQKLEVAARPTAVVQTLLIGSAPTSGVRRFDLLDADLGALIRGDDLASEPILWGRRPAGPRPARSRCQRRVRRGARALALPPT